MRTKYIVLEQGTPAPVVFPETMKHSDVARALGGKVLGAGFCYIENDMYVCYGASTSLHVNSREDLDAEILNTRLGNTY